MRLAVLTMTLCLLAGCATTRPCPKNTAPTSAQTWRASGKIFTLRHGGVLMTGGRTLQMTGLMKLDTGRGRADLAIFNGFGLKLAVLRVTPETTEVRQLSPMAEMIPHFAEQAGIVVRTLFLQGRPADQCAEVRNENSVRAAGVSFPATITFKELRYGYTVILRLKDVQIHDQ